MSRLLKKLVTLLISLIVFLALSKPSPVSAANCSFAPQPDSQEIINLIKQVQTCGGAAKYVPLKVLQVIYWIEGTEAYANPSAYVCKKNWATALGLMQIVDDEYHKLTPANEQLSDDQNQCAPTGKFSRCYPNDAVEIAARALLDKIYLWDKGGFKATGNISSKDDVYYASGRYYGSFQPDASTNQLAGYLSSNLLYPSGHPNFGTLTYSEFVCAMSGFCNSYQDYPARSDKPYSGAKTNPSYNFSSQCLHSGSTPTPIPVNFTVHPLRPYPYTLVKEETDKKISDSTLTPYCAMRPTAVQFNVHDKRDPTTKIYTIGTLTSNFQSFITPLLSITDPKKPDYTLSYPDKAQRYLADFLEGRAYYEPFTEPVNPTLDQQTDLFTRLGVFRKLAPKTYQDKLKRAVILRAAGQFDSLENPYGFPPATNEIHNYLVADWSGSKVYLKDFVNHWAPLPEEFDQNQDAYAAAYEAWKNLDAGKWYQLWPYVPMFTREDTKGFIQVLDDTGPPGPQKSDKKEVDVIHPHLARTYEVATSLSYLLSPASTHNAPTLELEEKWYSPAPWDTETPWWMKSYTAGGELGQSVCDFKPEVSLISSSGDLAKDDLITTSVNRIETLDPNPLYEGPPTYDPVCGVDLYPCEKCKIIPGIGYEIDDSNCRVIKDARYDPTYFFTYTPFLNQILTSLTESPRGIFDFFKTTPASADKTTDWPGVGNPGEESPVYDFKSIGGEKSLAEAGYHKPGNNQSFLYRYLGTIQCAKEKVLAVLQPFISDQPYEYFSPECRPEKISTVGFCSGEAFFKLNPPSQTTTRAKEYFTTFILPKLTEDLVSVYAQAEQETEVPCEVLAAVHFMEGGNNPNSSLISGRPLGTPEPDAGGLVFHSLLDTAIYAGNELKQKVNGDLTTMEKLITALSRYNGGGNANCRPSYSCSYATSTQASIPNCPVDHCCNLSCRQTCAQNYSRTVNDFVYPIPSISFCPRQYEGEDDPYPISMYNDSHLEMYLLYCLDRTMCTPQLFTRPGAATVATDFYNINQ